MYNLIIYIVIMAIVVWTMDGVNLNRIFKQNKVNQARIMYIMIVFSLTYLVSSFIIAFLGSLK
jgi:uncharacterized membrane protein YwzB